MKSSSIFPELKCESVESCTRSPISYIWTEGGLTRLELFSGMIFSGLISSDRGEDMSDDGCAIISIELAQCLIRRLDKINET